MNTQINTKAFRRSLQHSANYHHSGFGHEAEVTERLNADYQGQLMQELRANKYLRHGNITIRLATAFGFCWGVERAVGMAYEARQHFPEQRIWITGEIIHNPFVNQKLRDMCIEFVPEQDGDKDFSDITSNDVVIIPGAGATLQEMQLLQARGCKIVDTTCPWVVKVWNRVEKHKKGDYTSIIHGKRKHDETMATSSFADRYLIVQTLTDAETVCDYILKGGDQQAFMAKFGNACSPNFDPDRDLQRVGIANQTTMLKSETEQIGKLFERTMMKKYGPTNLDHHFQPFNTICNATQERQDAMRELLEQPLDVVVVVGGFNSSNTSHLHQMAISKGVKAYHIDASTRISLEHGIEHQTLEGQLALTKNWLPEGEIVVGVTAGASTPDKPVADVIAKILQHREKLSA